MAGQGECQNCINKRTVDVWEAQERRDEAKRQKEQQVLEQKQEAKRQKEQRALQQKEQTKKAKNNSNKNQPQTENKDKHPPTGFLAAIPSVSILFGIVIGIVIYFKTNDLIYAGGGVAGGSLAAALALHIAYLSVIFLIELLKVALKLVVGLLVILFIGLWFNASWAHDFVQFLKQFSM